jgi:hypothetical protein
LWDLKRIRVGSVDQLSLIEIRSVPNLRQAQEFLSAPDRDPNDFYCSNTIDLATEDDADESLEDEYLNFMASEDDCCDDDDCHESTEHQNKRQKLIDSGHAFIVLLDAFHDL